MTSIFRYCNESFFFSHWYIVSIVVRQLYVRFIGWMCATFCVIELVSSDRCIGCIIVNVGDIISMQSLGQIVLQLSHRLKLAKRGGLEFLLQLSGIFYYFSLSSRVNLGGKLLEFEILLLSVV